MDLPIPAKHQSCPCAGPDHGPECFVPQRTIVVEFKTRMVIKMPRCFDVPDIQFAMNDSSACMSHYVDQLHRETHAEKNVCTICRRSEMTYLREATEQDYKDLKYLQEKE